MASPLPSGADRARIGRQASPSRIGAAGPAPPSLLPVPDAVPLSEPPAPDRPDAGNPPTQGRAADGLGLLASMTGFARLDGVLADASWTWELKSVNNRGLDIRFRLPTGCDALEADARARLAARFSRGSVSAQLSVSREATVAAYRINEGLLSQLLDLALALSPQGVAPPRLDGLLAVRGVVELVEPGSGVPDGAMLAALADAISPAIDALAEARAAEGARLGRIVLDQLERVAALTARARGLAAAQPQALRARLLEAVRAVVEQMPTMSEDRLAQEVAILAAKADVREELDRLDAHVAQVRELLAAGGPVGRRLDFLCQELNREANTLCSKSADTELTRTGLDLKAVIEQMREQIQNLE